MTPRFIRERTLEQSFTVSTTLLVLILIGTTMLVVHSRVASSLRRGLRGRGLSIARSIGAVATPSLLAYNYPALQIAAEGASEDEGVAYVVIHDKEGQVAGLASRETFRDEGAWAKLPPGELPADYDVAITDGRGNVRDVLEVAVPVKVEGAKKPWGTVRVGLSKHSLRAELKRLDLGLLVLGLALIALAVTTARWVARKITAPLRALAEGAEALAAGDTSHRIPVGGARELADLAGTFNTMVDRVQEKARESEEFQNALERLNTTLEEQVRERTRALTESEAQYKTLVEHSPDSILIVQRGRVRFVNAAFSATFGVPEDQALAEGFNLYQIFDAQSAPVVRARIEGWVRGESAGPAEVHARNAAGRRLDLELRGSGIEYRGRRAAECILVDMTETREIREHLAETERLRALGELAGGVAHDFNNLLGAILARAQLLRRRKLEDGADRELAVIERAAQDGRETVRRIQEFARTRKDRERTPVDLSDVIRDAMEITRTRWQAETRRRNIELRMDVELAAVPPILGSAAELREVFTNLILNALDAMPRGGELHLSCRRDGGRVCARVRDNGLGMSEEVRRHLFDPFFSTKGTQGLGLGLSVAYGIVTRHEGRIEVASTPGRGTTFTLEFPVAQETMTVANQGGPAVASTLRPGKILVIDDEPEIADVMRDILAAGGHSVETALTGSDGLQAAAAAAFDMVFTDLGMPDMSGWEVVRQIRSSQPQVPVVLVTGWGATLDPEEVRQRGVTAVVHKPFEVDELLRVAADTLQATGPAAGRTDT